MIRVPFFLPLGFKKETSKQKGQKGTTREPSIATSNRHLGHDVRDDLPTEVGAVGFRVGWGFRV